MPKRMPEKVPETIPEAKSVKIANRDREIGELLNRYSQFIQVKDLNGILELIADDVVVFDLIEPFQFNGSRALMNRLVTWFKGFEGGIDYNFDQLRIHSNETLAVAHALVNCSGVMANDSKRTSMWMRVTFTFMKTDGEWLISHQHTSEPFDMETMRAVQQRDTH